MPTLYHNNTYLSHKLIVRNLHEQSILQVVYMIKVVILHAYFDTVYL